MGVLQRERGSALKVYTLTEQGRALASLSETCPSPKNFVLRQTVGAGEAAAK